MQLIQIWRKELDESLASSDPMISRKAQADLHRRITRFEDSRYGSCLLADPGAAGIVQTAFIFGHGIHYKLIEWVIMPNHVRVLIRLLDDTQLAKIIQKWKGTTALQINKLLDRTGRLWHPDYHDRFIRDLDHYHNAIAYIHNNPVKAGLCENPAGWPHSSAYQNRSMDSSPALPIPRSD